MNVTFDCLGRTFSSTVAGVQVAVTMPPLQVYWENEDFEGSPRRTEVGEPIWVAKPLAIPGGGGVVGNRSVVMLPNVPSNGAKLFLSPGIGTENSRPGQR